MKLILNMANVTRSISRLYGFIVNPYKNQDPEKIRRIRILNTIFLIFLVLALSSQFIWLFNFFIGKSKNIGSIINIFIPGFFILLTGGLLFLTKKGFYRVSAWIFIILLIFANIQTSMIWGDNVPSVIACYAFILIISGLVIGPKTAILIMITISIIRIGLFYLHDFGLIKINTSWSSLQVSINDIMIINFIYLVVSVVSWMSSRELFRSYNLTINSEKKAVKLANKLKKQNENLEKMIDDRTKELRENQLKQLTEMSGLAELGLLSAGLLHDIKNPLTVISMNLDSINDSTNEVSKLKKINVKDLIKKSLKASKMVETIIKASQRQLGNEDKKEWFNLNREIKNTLVLLNCRANKLGIKINFRTEIIGNVYSFPTKISRVVANLVINSIEALEKVKNNNKTINIVIEKEKNIIVIKVIDNGVGIKNEVKDKIFQTSYTTKKYGAGLGLHVSQEMIKKYFLGEINFTSIYKKGSEFLIKFPIKKNEIKNSKSNK